MSRPFAASALLLALLPAFPALCAEAPTYPLVVRFASIGAGTDGAAEGEVLRIIARHGRALGVPLRHHRTPWGREGEFDACYPLEGLSEADRQALVAELRATVRSERVSVEEDFPCSPDRSR